MDAKEFIRQSEALARRQEELQGRKVGMRHMQPGEDPGCALPEDAANWSAVYQELIKFKRELVADVERKVNAAREPGVRDELEHDRAILRSELERLELHEAFWSERVSRTS